MLGNNRKTIGVFVTQQFQEYQAIIGNGICSRAEELGYNVAFFTNFLGYGDFQYEIGERSIADLPNYDMLDGIILLPDTMYVPGYLNRILENIKRDCSCPVVSVRQKIDDDFYNVLIDDTFVLEDIIKHMVVDHGYKKINFLTGPRDNLVSKQRRETFIRVLSENNIEFEEDRVFYGDFWKNDPKLAVEKWLKDPDNLPEAIICANDFMAITVCNELTKRGISVPDDIAVTGCDDIMLSKEFYPAISTVNVPVYDMGVEAINKLYKHFEGIEQEKNSYLNTSMILRESCGCKNHVRNFKAASKRNRFINKVEDMEKDAFNNALMSVELTSITTIDRLDKRLASFTYMIEGFSSFYLLLHKNWDLYTNEESEKITDKNEMIMEVGIKKGEWLQKKEFSKPNLLPSVHVGEEPQIFFFNMIHYREVCFGYAAISFKTDTGYQSSYQGWLVNISNTLEKIRVHNELNRLVFKLEDMYIKDDLTDLYNRRALDSLGQKYLQQCIDKKSSLMVFTADMDKLKYINDNYGHAYGDIAIKAAADALKAASKDDEICMRVGGDEFVVIGMDYDEQKIVNFIQNFEHEIDEFNEHSGKLFKVDVSYGWSIINPNSAINIEDCLIITDSKMYKQKYEKETLRLKHRIDS